VRYTDLLNQELNLLAQLPGMVAVALFRPNAKGQLVATQVAGKQGEGLADLLLQPEFEISIDANLPQGQRKSAIAWRERRILSAPAYARDSIYPHWREAINRFGIRSHLAIPIFDFTRNPQAVLCLYGGFPNQFESPYMKQFADALQYRFGEIQARSTSQHVPTITLEEGREWLQALFTGGLRMYVQPILDLTEGRVSKVEALARLQLPDGRILSPGQFLPLLGDSELNRMFVMGLDIALGHRTVWATSGIEVQVSVNLPTQALQEPDCIQWVAKALAKHNTPASALTLELLETGVISEGGMGQTLTALRQMGVQLAMDDLGSGYSSLLRLAELPFDYLKIDQGIMKRVHQAPLDIFSVISAIAQMGENFERSIVAEGLEDYGMLEAAAILGAEFGQGYCIAKPMPAEALPNWLEGFVFPIDPQGEIRTALGALAYFWLSTRNGRHHRQIHVTSCRLHGYLLAQNLPEDSDPMRWHRLTHDEDSVEAIAAMLHLKNWLSEQAQTERAVDCPVL
jgi:EAL domain-containing protein (putative c-di-GMP-specific phosphodiesterase class I)